MFGSSATVQAAVAASPVLTTAVAAAAPSTSSAVASNELTASSGDGGMEFTLDAATLEQLRGAGDASVLMDSSSTSAAGFGETSDDQSAMQVDGCADDWVQGLVQLDGPMDSDDVADEDGDDDEAAGELDDAGAEEAEGAGAEGGFDAEGLDSAAEGGADVVGEEGFGGAVDELSAAAASAAFSAAELSSHAAALDADDPAAAYMIQVGDNFRCLRA